MERMLERGWLGEKRGQGFYQRVGKGSDQQLWALDRTTLEYRLAQKVSFPAVEAVRGMEDLGTRLRALVVGEDRASQFVWRLLRDFAVHAARMVPEISGRVVEIDRAMRWGYGFTLGPFEMWDALGLVETVERMRREGCAIPGNVERMLESGGRSFYEESNTNGEPRTRYFDLELGRCADLELRPGMMVLREIKRARGVLRSNRGASLVDLGDGVLCLELQGKLNALDDDAAYMVETALEELDCGHEALVIANDSEDFSLGPNLKDVLLAAQAGQWDKLDAAVRRFQAACMAIKYAPRPVVAAVSGMALGGGCELALHAGRVQASAETHMGLLEVGVGLIPSGGGCKEMLLRLGDARKAFELMGHGKVSENAARAREMGFLRPRDWVTMNRERLVADAKNAALAMVAGWSPAVPGQDIAVEGVAGYAALKMGIRLAVEGEYISDYDCAVGEKLAYVLSGGRLTGTQKVSEQYLLDLEREAFLSLCGNVKTQERIRYMLKHGKALVN
jgi:3-hydroxyacyl-CoA dehydrogenase